MPLFNSQAPIVAFQPIQKVETITPINLAADTPTDILDVDNDRKGHSIKNTGTVTVDVFYGLPAPEGVGFSEIYKIPLKPNEVYLFDAPEIIPYSATAIGGAGIISVYELA